MSNFSLQVPINSTSLGQVTTNLLFEIFNKRLEPNIFPISQVDLSSFNGLLPNEFGVWLQNCINKSLKDFKRTEPSLRLWHINGSHETVSNYNFLYFFHELDNLTSIETNILKSFEKTFSPCKFTQKVAEDACIKNIDTINLGYNNLAFKEVPIKKYEAINGIEPIVIILAGKFEKRKHTAKMINILFKKYGNNSLYKIHLHIYNPFYDQQNQERCKTINNKLISDSCEGKIPFNFVVLPHFPLLTDLNQAYNMADIVVDGSGGESWSLPSFHMAGLGKQCVIHNCTGIKEWANKDNSILVESNNQIPAEDGMFFRRGAPFNDGNIYDFEEKDMEDAIEMAVQNIKKKIVNKAGTELTEKFTYDSMCEQLLSEMGI